MPLLDWCVQLGVHPRYDIRKYIIIQQILANLQNMLSIIGLIITKSGGMNLHELIVALTLLTFEIHSSHMDVHTILQIIVENFIKNNGRFVLFLHLRGTISRDS